jgi:hypothetical protein
MVKRALMFLHIEREIREEESPFLEQNKEEEKGKKK